MTTPPDSNGKDLPVTAAIDVVRVLGGPTALRTLFANATGHYQCQVCRQPGHAHATAPATVMVVVFDHGTGRRMACLVHPDCAESSVVIVDGPVTVGTTFQTMPAWLWSRPPGCDPPVAVAFTPTCRVVHVMPTGDTVDRLTTALLNWGFTRITQPRAALPRLVGPTVRRHESALAVHDPSGRLLFQTPLDANSTWAHTATTDSHLGVVLATGPKADDPNRGHQVDPAAAIASGAAVGAAVPLTHP